MERKSQIVERILLESIIDGFATYKYQRQHTARGTQDRYWNMIFGAASEK